MTVFSPRICTLLDSWLRFAQQKGGYAFRSVYDPAADLYHYDGYIAGEGNKEQIDNENVPFVTTTGYLEDDAVPCMVLFIEEGRTHHKASDVAGYYGPQGGGCSR